MIKILSKKIFFDKTDFVAIGVGQDEEPLLATSANITWENCSSFLVNNWQYDAFYDMNVPYTTNVPNLDWVRGYNANYSANEYGYEYYNNNYTYNYDLASNGMFTLRATSQIPFANKKRVSVTTRTTDPYFSYSYTSHYNNYVPGDFVVVNPLEFSFTVNEETGDISDIVAESRIDQIDFSYRMSKNDYSYYWVHYLDPQVRNEITLPKLNMGFTNDLDWYYSPRAVDYNIYDSMDDILNALFVNNTHRGSSYTYSYSFYSIPFSSTSRSSNHIIIREEQDPYGMQRY